VDVVIDPVGGDTMARSRQVLREAGPWSPSPNSRLGATAGDMVLRGVYFVIRPDAGELRELAILIDKQQVRPWSRRSSSSAFCQMPFRAQRARRDPGKAVITSPARQATDQPPGAGCARRPGGTAMGEAGH